MHVHTAKVTYCGHTNFLSFALTSSVVHLYPRLCSCGFNVSGAWRAASMHCTKSSISFLHGTSSKLLTFQHAITAVISARQGGLEEVFLDILTLAFNFIGLMKPWNRLFARDTVLCTIPVSAYRTASEKSSNNPPFGVSCCFRSLRRCPFSLLYIFQSGSVSRLHSWNGEGTSKGRYSERFQQCYHLLFPTTLAYRSLKFSSSLRKCRETCDGSKKLQKAVMVLLEGTHY